MRKIHINFVILVVLIFSFILIPKDINAVDHHGKNILFISSYSPKFISFNDQINGLEEGFDDSYDVHIEYMDVKNFRSDELEENFYNLLKFKIKSYEKFDAIVLGDDAALEFGLKYKSDLFKDIPMVFFGATDEINIELAKEKGIDGGVVEYASISETLDLIGKIYGGYKNIILLTGNHIKYNREISEFYSFKSKYKNFDFEYISMPPEVDSEFIEKLSKIDKDKDVVLFVYPYRDGIGKSISVSEAIQIIKHNISSPVFTTLSYDISNDVIDGTNIIGGKVIDFKQQALKAAQLVDSILKEEINLPQFIYSNEANIWMFNYDNIKLNNISFNKIPPESIILNKPLPFSKKYEDIIVPMLLTLIALILIILTLVLHTIKTIKHKNELQKAKQIAEDANIAKSNFIATISHELRTPVAVISSANQLLKVLLHKNNDEQKICIQNKDSINNNLDIVSQNSNRLLRLINNIIDVAKIDSGFSNLKLKKVNIINLIEESVLSVIPYASAKKLDIVFDTNVEDLDMVVDTEKIERIVLNLLSNAIKFSRPNDSIFATIIADENYLNFTVKDNGIGIDKDNLDKIFEKFMQIDNGLTRQNEGSGIGLSIVKSFIKLHYGTIKVDSKLNEGSSFIIKLPIKSDLCTKTYNDIPSLDINADIELSDIFK
ncbi:MAG: sensor histidine kinase [Romboutsia sp.]|uniref:sensor histidine kinase n=1 Tax=Romboutsia sp. TaxID=1965302 RepID=UPI003F2CD6C6